MQIFLFITFEVNNKYENDRTSLDIFINEQCTNQENKKIGQVLSMLIPDFAKDSFIQRHSTFFPENQKNVTIIFCEICDFDKLLTIKQKDIISFVDEVYRKFDSFCSENHVKKIEVI